MAVCIASVKQLFFLQSTCNCVHSSENVFFPCFSLPIIIIGEEIILLRQIIAFLARMASTRCGVPVISPFFGCCSSRRPFCADASAGSSEGEPKVVSPLEKVYEFRSYHIKEDMWQQFKDLTAKKIQANLDVSTCNIYMYSTTTRVTEFGKVYLADQIWRYDSESTRAAERRRLQADESWVKDYMHLAYPTMSRQDNCLMLAIPQFLPRKGSPEHTRFMLRTTFLRPGLIQQYVSDLVKHYKSKPDVRPLAAWVSFLGDQERVLQLFSHPEDDDTSIESTMVQAPSEVVTYSAAPFGQWSPV